MAAKFGVVDLFAGPGGLGEGFAALGRKSHEPFQIGISVEKEASAYRTLMLRAFLREYRRRHDKTPKEFLEFHAGTTAEPDWSDIDADAWAFANKEAYKLELGTRSATEELDRAIRRIKNKYDDTILIGGPPCQAYSLVGRARSRSKVGYVPEEDERHYLFREYIRVLQKLRPAAFVMENVKGILSSTVESRLVFEMLMEDLSSIGRGRGQSYELRAIQVSDGLACLSEIGCPSDFVVRAEDFGLPQRRHRVIIIGIRSDCITAQKNNSIKISTNNRSVSDVIGAMPRLRSGISRRNDHYDEWVEEIHDAARSLEKIYKKRGPKKLHDIFLKIAKKDESFPKERVGSSLYKSYGKSNDELLNWLERPELYSVAQHETRGHMASDLKRYLFAASFGKTIGFSPQPLLQAI